MRKSAARSITRTPASTSSAACFIAMPLGVAKNTASHFSRAASCGVTNLRSTRRRRLGNMSDTAMPASPREVIAVSSTPG